MCSTNHSCELTQWRCWHWAQCVSKEYQHLKVLCVTCSSYQTECIVWYASAYTSCLYGTVIGYCQYRMAAWWQAHSMTFFLAMSCKISQSTKAEQELLHHPFSPHMSDILDWFVSLLGLNTEHTNQLAIQTLYLACTNYSRSPLWPPL